jgi:ethanolamine ammonia-lyase small subunit
MATGKLPVTANPWQALRRFTGARIALGRAGTSLPTAVHLEFQLAHARARDAVHLPFDAAGVAAAVGAHGFTTVTVRSAAGDRHTYLQRPDLGRRLDATSRADLEAGNAAPAPPRHDLAFVVADGLSALAVHQHAAALLGAMQERLAPGGWRIAPVVLVRHGRVAIGDEIGELLGAGLVAVLIGERPGLSSPDSLGIYLTWAPRVGLTDASRNCISNVRPAGLPIEQAAQKLHYLLDQARTRQLTGIGLKDEVDAAPALAGATPSHNFLLEGPVD